MICNSDATVTITNYDLIIDQLGSLDSSRDLQPICAKSFVNIFYLVLQNSKVPFQKFTQKRSKQGRSSNALQALDASRAFSQIVDEDGAFSYERFHIISSYTVGIVRRKMWLYIHRQESTELGNKIIGIQHQSCMNTTEFYTTNS